MNPTQIQAPHKPKKQQKLVTQTDDFGRKKFLLVDKQQNSQPEDNNNDKFIETMGKHRSTLIGRDQKIDTNKYIGKIQTNKKNKKTQVFYCDICKLGFKCDLAYITHVNSPQHNRKLGMNMKVSAVSVETVSEKLARLSQENKYKSKKQAKMAKIIQKSDLKSKIEEQQKKYKQEQRQDSDGQQAEEQYHSHEQNKEIEAKEEKIQQKLKQQHQSNKQSEGQEDSDQIMMKTMGFQAGFANKNKKY